MLSSMVGSEGDERRWRGSQPPAAAIHQSAVFQRRIVFAVVVFLFALSATAESKPEFDFTRYHDFPEFEAYLHEAAQQYPHIVRLVNIGRSREGRDLLGLKIGSPIDSVDKPAVWIDGGNHAREWPAFHLSIYFIDLLLSGFETDPTITGYLKRLNFYIFPVLNPDGFIFSRTSKRDMVYVSKCEVSMPDDRFTIASATLKVRQWRKNRAPTNCSGFGWNVKKADMCCEGVDLNRNWDVAFSHDNYPFNNPCSDEFQGPRPFSEPEARALRDFVLSPEINGRVKAMVSMHTHGQLFILPYNYKRKTYPNDYAELEKLALRAATAISALRSTEYRVGTGVDLLGVPATGGATDWIKMNTQIKYIYVVELPPELTTSFAFQMKPHWLVPAAQETWAGVKVIVEQVLSEFAKSEGKKQ